MLSNIKNIVVLSGGSGNDAILKALINMGYSDKDIRVIVNAYDDGKSTGVCREVTGTLGVSDIRKNHEKLHEMFYGNAAAYKFIMNLYKNRIDIDSDYTTSNIIFDKIIKDFFNRNNSKYFSYNNFNIMNIIYSQLYSSIGYEATNALFSKILGIDDMVKMNSFDNVKIIAKTEKGNIIIDEGDIVEWKNPDDKIIDINFVGKSVRGINPEAIKLISDADLIIISTGTFWSSLYPTLSYLNFYKYINKSSAKKLWVVNSEQDKDAFGVSSVDFYNFMHKLGLKIEDFSILMNTEADEILKRPINNSNLFDLGNTNGRNDYKKVRIALEQIYG